MNRLTDAGIGRARLHVMSQASKCSNRSSDVWSEIVWKGLRERDLLFQTLDTTMRRVKLPSGGRLAEKHDHTATVAHARTCDKQYCKLR